MTDNNERRSAIRFHTLNLLSYTVRDSVGETLTQGYAKTLDLSETGALLEVPERFKNPDNVDFEIALEEEIFKLDTDIVDQKNTEDGNWQVRVKFKNLRPAHFHKIAMFIHNL